MQGRFSERKQLFVLQTKKSLDRAFQLNQTQALSIKQS